MASVSTTSPIQSIVTMASRLFPAGLRHRFYASAWWNQFGKNADELQYWHDNLDKMLKWYERKETWRGFPFPEGKEREERFGQQKNAVMSYINAETAKATYLSDLRLRADSFATLKIGDIGSGPMPTLRVFEGCERIHIDHLINDFRRLGYPIDEYEESDCRFVSAKSENLPFSNGEFDVLLSRNALDHVDDFRATSKEMLRVLKPEGYVHMLINHHEPTRTETQAITEDMVFQSFRGIGVRKVYEDEGAWGFKEGKSVLWTSLPESMLSLA